MKSALGMCINWKVLLVLGAVAAGILAFAPGYAFAALPLLLLAACPLSMGLMMFVMMRMGGHGNGSAAEECQPGSVEALRQRLAAVREEERRLERQLSGSAQTPGIEPDGASALYPREALN